MKKVLIVSTVSRQFYLFEQGNIEVLKSLGYEVHGAANFEDANERLDVLGIIRHHFDIQRSPFSMKNYRAYKQLKRIMMSENFNAVHCHSPMGGVLARLAAKSVGIPSIIYTAHGFHFYKGAPLINWMLYYPIEKWLSRYTDVLITINKEDYITAKCFRASKVEYIPGIGIDSDRFSKVDIDIIRKRKEIGVQENSFVILSVGELNKNKNHEVILKAISILKNNNIRYVICGQGALDNYLKELAEKLGVSEKVRMLGFRNDVKDIYLTADLFAFPSYREGLSVSLMEAMASGLPVICSNIRGNSDLIENGNGGFLCDPEDISGFAKGIDIMINDDVLRKKMGERNLVEVNQYDKQIVKAKMKEIYEGINL